MPGGKFNAQVMRQEMSYVLCSLEQVYHEIEIGRELTKDERLARYAGWNIGLNEQTLSAYYNTYGRQQEAEEQKSGTKKEKKVV